MATTKSKTILVLEQKSDWRDLLIHIVEGCGYKVIAIGDPREIAEAIRNGPDLILLDIGLLNEQAETIITNLQKDPATKSTPILCLATYGGEWPISQVIKAGAKEVLYKPFDLSDLPSILRKHLFPEA